MDNDTRFALVDSNGLVVNTIIGPANYKDPFGLAAYATNVGCIGWTTADQGQSFIAPAMTISDLLDLLNGAQNSVLGSIWTFDVGTSGAPMVLTTSLDPSGQAAMLKLAVWSQMNAGSNSTEAYSNVDYTGANITPAQAGLLSSKAGAIVSTSYVTLNKAAAQIIAGSMTTAAQVAAVQWPDPKNTQ